ncbi:MAG: NUDIX hydrolase [Micromonosporaceae bacterium]
MTTGQQLRRMGFKVFYALPVRWRRQLVRVIAPRYIVGSVALVRDLDAPAPGRLLLLRQPPGVGWSLPAGLLRRGESALEGAARELAEESGIALSLDAFTPASPSAVVHARGRWVDAVFEAAVPAHSATLRVDGAEVLDAQWHRLDALPPLTLPTARLLAHYGIGPLASYPQSVE